MSQIMPTPTGARRYQRRGWIGAALALSFGLSGVAAGQSRHPELRRLHALLVIDTRSGLGESVKVDGTNVDRLLSSRLPKDRVEIKVLTGNDVSAEMILSYYRGLKVGRNDSLLFYYAGHG